MVTVVKAPLADTWKRRITRCRKSGLSVAAFCRREEISVPSLYAWRRRFSSAEVLATAAPQAAPSEVQNPPFVPVKLKSAPISIELLLTSGHILRLPEDFDVGRLATLLKAVGAC